MIGKFFAASLSSVATASTLALSGVYLDWRCPNIQTRPLALLAKDVAIPALFFSKLVTCRTDNPSGPSWYTTILTQRNETTGNGINESDFDAGQAPPRCHNVLDHIGSVWILVFWPLYVVGCGLVVGIIMSRLSRTPRAHVPFVLASCAFSNSNSLPLALLATLMEPSKHGLAIPELQSVDPMLLLPVYSLLYSLIQWGLGGWLVSSGAETELMAMNNSELHRQQFNPNEGIQANEEFEPLRLIQDEEAENKFNGEGNFKDHGRKSSGTVSNATPICYLIAHIRSILGQTLQPPSIGTFVGFVVVATPPLRNLFISPKQDHVPPLRWFLHGVSTIGQAAVPLSMTILGANLSAAASKSFGRHVDSNEDAESNGRAKHESIPRRTLLAIVMGKMVILPIVGFATVWFIKTTFWRGGGTNEATPALILVMTVVMLTPTANNVQVMVELNDGKKEDMARILGFQYLAAPIILSITFSAAVRLAKSE